MIRRKVFISYYHGDQEAVDSFIRDYRHVFIPKVLGAEGMTKDIINSNNPEYVMRRIREKYLEDSTVTIVLIGSCTHSRRYVDWEIKSSLKQNEKYLPNGLIGIRLPNRESSSAPPRLVENLGTFHRLITGRDNGYARCHNHPNYSSELQDWIEDAHNARSSRRHLIKNSQDMMKDSKQCTVHGITHQ